MKRVLLGLAFALVALLAGPLTYLAATVVVFNLVRGLLLFLSNIFQMYDFSFVPNLIAGAIALGISWALGALGLFLWRRVMPSRAEAIAPFISSTLIVVMTLFIASLVLAGVLTYTLNASALGVADLLPELSADGLQAWMVLLATTALYQPLSWALFVISVASGDHLLDASKGVKNLAAFGLILPIITLIIWLIAQWITGGIF